MSPGREAQHWADTIAAWTVGAGIGLITLMLTWLVGNRLAGLVMEPPRGPTIAFSIAVGLGMAATALAGKRLAATAASEA